MSAHPEFVLVACAGGRDWRECLRNKGDSQSSFPAATWNVSAFVGCTRDPGARRAFLSAPGLTGSKRGASFFSLMFFIVEGQALVLIG